MAIKIDKKIVGYQVQSEKKAEEKTEEKKAEDTAS